MVDTACGDRSEGRGLQPTTTYVSASHRIHNKLHGRSDTQAEEHSVF